MWYESDGVKKSAAPQKGSPSELIDARIMELDDWRGTRSRPLRRYVWVRKRRSEVLRDCARGLADVAALERFDYRQMPLERVQSGFAGAKDLELGAFGHLDHACE
jgi:hypothetical protein